ncbi:MAG: hypothetical protein J5924_04490, partial [Bacteroidaceae bacterium]|nr:hypothetical protein [Bacteroidaceae bacterium]
QLTIDSWLDSALAATNVDNYFHAGVSLGHTDCTDSTDFGALRGSFFLYQEFENLRILQLSFCLAKIFYSFSSIPTMNIACYNNSLIL